MNSDIWKGKTKEVKGQLKSWWGKLTDNDLERIEGSAEQLAGRLQERYGWTKEQVKKEINKRFAQFDRDSYTTSSNYAKGYKGKSKTISPNTENLEDAYTEAEYEAAEGDLTQRRPKFQKQITTENPVGWDEPEVIDRVEPL